ncbi:unnamed protein product [Soboliphyme baturini]|uniref:Tyrosine-protein kinase CSK n=1 Tax=Soboliphyme baturini TaxID=241478 RepID=A0A183IP56_9BILA|nr:unnamed protein product [Soboliphyme baturini]
MLLGIEPPAVILRTPQLKMGNCCETSASTSNRHKLHQPLPQHVAENSFQSSGSPLVISADGQFRFAVPNGVQSASSPNQVGTPLCRRTTNVPSVSIQSPAPVPAKKPFTPGSVVLIALYPYESRADGDLSFKKGDTMLLLDNSNADWWYVKHLATEQTGYVPRNFVARQESPESEEWFAGRIPRNVAEKLVMNPGLLRGTFLIRERETECSEYALTIRDKDEEKGENVKHYKIKRLENGGFFITTRRTFATLQDLVKYYSGKSGCFR